MPFGPRVVLRRSAIAIAPTNEDWTERMEASKHGDRNEEHMGRRGQIRFRQFRDG